MKYKLIAVDMDDTCLNSRSIISKENLYWLNKAKEKGIEIVPTSGRSLKCLPYQIKDSGLFDYCITSNGAVVTDIINNTDIFKSLIPKGEIVKLMKECSGKDIGMIAHVNYEYLVQGKLFKAMGMVKYGKDARNAISYKDLISVIENGHDDVEEAQFFFFSDNARKRTEDALMKYDNLLASWSDRYVEIYSRDATKGRALRVTCDHLNVHKNEVACIGNGENDLTMFEESGLCFAVDNAVDELKKAADHIVASNNDNGVAEAIQIILNTADC